MPLADSVCDICGENFKNAQGVAAHKEKIHGDIDCDMCHENFKTEQQLLKHKDKEHPAKPMIIDTAPPPAFNKETGKWEFPKSAEQLEQEALVKQGPPKRAISSDNNNNENNNAGASPPGRKGPPPSLFQGKKGPGVPRYASAF
ncbi:C2H2-type zinc finger containing protein, putative [Angomonas deanei]|uniref:C2H2-type zinc finger containing protein, putative n=1 Tax=Angomonas deanei TaxID=59799 RepID=A0A7G2CHG8_9TRYP|nr:C2H2-type zinc finger containing protein, putative [Angomonas deanei]